jgi:HSP20 family protein
MAGEGMWLQKVECITLNFDFTSLLEEPPMLLRSATVRDLDQLTTRVFDTATRSSGARLDAYREGNSFYIDIDLPGVDPATIDVTVDRKVLTVRAERTRARREGLQYVVTERPMGTFTRQVFLSESLDTDRLEARYDNGVLTLSIPVTEKAQPRKFDIATRTPAGDQELAAA